MDRRRKRPPRWVELQGQRTMTDAHQIAHSNDASATPVVLSVDWGRLAPKRAVYQASHESRWQIARVAPPAGGWSLKHLLERAAGLAHTRDTSVIVGIDAVIGAKSEESVSAKSKSVPARNREQIKNYFSDTSSNR